MMPDGSVPLQGAVRGQQEARKEGRGSCTPPLYVCALTDAFSRPPLGVLPRGKDAGVTGSVWPWGGAWETLPGRAIVALRIVGGEGHTLAAGIHGVDLVGGYTSVVTVAHEGYLVAI